MLQSGRRIRKLGIKIKDAILLSYAVLDGIFFLQNSKGNRSICEPAELYLLISYQYLHPNSP